MRTDLFTHPKVFKIAEALGKDEMFAVGALFAFWSWIDRHSVDGRVDGATSQLVDRATRVDGLAAALTSVGWLSVDEGGICIPEFGEHNGDSAKERSLKNQRQARWRERKADGLVGSEASTASSTRASTSASTREEKRREELSTTSNEVVVDSDTAADLFVVEGGGKPASRPACPHQEIIALYHELLPMCSAIREWSGTRQVNLRTRWNEDKKRQDLGYWRKLFTYIGQSEFLTGRARTPEGRKPFIASLDWIVKAENFTKIREGRYHNEEAAA
ncbi:hypothetical protein K2O51_23095 [Cupriavidus pinatubonensis]|uniref:hypothetical protein n=1 Tax=Cupriavidus pinatubonensis TaxID=248026 RepID=UPI001C7364DA|nr:hypothetical protein [Cupriavidus pinatubonensis]QYY30260.1 hypothetical protein K2O51_23095 [Cupriavidus pinatubonensis]